MKKTMNKEIPNKNIDDAFKDYIRYCRVRNLAMATTDYYSFRESYKGKKISDIDEKVFQDYVYYLRNETKLNDISINTRIRGLRTILYYFMKLGYMKDFKIELIKATKKIKETYTDAELNILLEKPDVKTCNWVGYT